MNRHSLARFIRRWHARIGISAALFFIVLIITGVALNHTEQLNLAHINIRSPALARWYGLPVPQILAAYPEPAFVATPETWVYKGQRLADGGGEVVGALLLPDMLVVATAQSLHLYTLTGEHIDTLRDAALPRLPLVRLGRRDNAMILNTPEGLFSSTDGLRWQATRDNAVRWAEAQSDARGLSAQIYHQIMPSLPLERIVLDLHSGRLLGRYGPIVMDLAALVLLLLSLSGIWIQWRSWRQKQRHPHRS